MSLVEETKNPVIVEGDTLRVKLTKGQEMVTDNVLRVWEILRLHKFHISDWFSLYATTTVRLEGYSPKPVSFHVMYFGQAPCGMVIDHKDGNSLNNRVSNLQFVTPRIRSLKRKKSLANTTGVTGVKNDHGYWIAFWQDENRNGRSKCFSIRKYGDAQAKKLAVAKRKEMEMTLQHYVDAEKAKI